eukprot:COSAG01_NODE_11819_length_1853_cov_2.471494_1_plen_150_part_10
MLIVIRGLYVAIVLDRIQYALHAARGSDSPDSSRFRLSESLTFYRSQVTGTTGQQGPLNLIADVAFIRLRATRETQGRATIHGRYAYSRRVHAGVECTQVHAASAESAAGAENTLLCMERPAGLSRTRWARRRVPTWPSVAAQGGLGDGD